MHTFSIFHCKCRQTNKKNSITFTCTTIQYSCMFTGTTVATYIRFLVKYCYSMPKYGHSWSLGGHLQTMLCWISTGKTLGNPQVGYTNQISATVYNR